MPGTTRGGVRIDYEIHGMRGPTIVLAHAFPLSRAIWEPQIKELAGRHRLVLYDARGFGASEAPDRPEAYSMDEAVADMAAVMNAAGLQRAIVGGLSMGGNTAVNFALAHPDRASGLIVADTGAGSDEPESFQAVANGWAAVAQRDGIETFARVIMANSIFAEYADRGEAERGFMWRIISANSATAIAHICRRVLAARKPVYELEAGLRTLAMPTLIIVGARDAGCIAPSRFMARTCPDASLLVVPDTGHFNNLEAPGIFSRALADLARKVRE